jgi:cell wall-associated NlpC family hydrolase
MLRVLLVCSILFLQSCSLVSRYSVYPARIGETERVDLNLSEQQVRKKLELAYQRWQGTPYRYGHQVPGLGADCSGFTQLVYKNQFSINLPRTTRKQIDSGQVVSLSNARAGDLVFFNLGNGYGHVAIYLDDNIVMQATSSKGVTKTDLNTSNWWAKRVFKIKRIIL